jgi:hypothetical protein
MLLVVNYFSAALRWSFCIGENADGGWIARQRGPAASNRHLDFMEIRLLRVILEQYGSMWTRTKGQSLMASPTSSDQVRAWPRALASVGGIEA